MHFGVAPEWAWGGFVVSEAVAGPTRRVVKGAKGLLLASYDRAHYDERMALMKEEQEKADRAVIGSQDPAIKFPFNDPSGYGRTDLLKIFQDPFNTGKI